LFIIDAIEDGLKRFARQIVVNSRVTMANQEIALALSAACFGLVVGFLAGLRGARLHL
jgi:hypothetical protein